MDRSLAVATTLAMCLVLGFTGGCSGADPQSPAPPSTTAESGEGIPNKPLRDPGQAFPVPSTEPSSDSDGDDDSDGSGDSRGNGGGGGGATPIIPGSGPLPK